MPRLFITDRRELRPYHLYNQGAKRGGRPRKVFVDREDKQFFLSLLARHLGRHPASDSRSRPYQHLRGWITLIAFNVMTTHFHLIVWQRDPRGIDQLMNNVKAVYTRYFNAKYGNVDPLFNGPVQSKPVDGVDYFKWLVGYVHKNHPTGESYEFSSHRAWVEDDRRPGWLDPDPGIKVFGGLGAYREQMDRYDAKRALDTELGFGRRR